MAETHFAGETAFVKPLPVKFTWKLTGVDASLTSTETGKGYESSAFPAFGGEWYLRLYFNGDVPLNRGFLSLFLHLTKAPASPLLKGNLSLYLIPLKAPATPVVLDYSLTVGSTSMA
jgi:hypothetical protein